jgi:hypothetical protein
MCGLFCAELTIHFNYESSTVTNSYYGQVDVKGKPSTKTHNITFESTISLLAQFESYSTKNNFTACIPLHNPETMELYYQRESFNDDGSTLVTQAFHYIIKVPANKTLNLEVKYTQHLLTIPYVIQDKDNTTTEGYFKSITLTAHESYSLEDDQRVDSFRAVFFAEKNTSMECPKPPSIAIEHSTSPEFSTAERSDGSVEKYSVCLLLIVLTVSVFLIM